MYDRMRGYMVLNMRVFHNPLIVVQLFWILLLNLRNAENSVIKEHKDYYSKIEVF